jgi:hypothetical protein
MEGTMNHFVGEICHKARLEVFLDNHEAIDFRRSQSFVQEGFLQKDE